MKANVLTFIGLVLIVIQVTILANMIAKCSYSDAIRQSLDESLERTMHMTRVDSETHLMSVVSNADERNALLGKGTLQISNGTLGDFKTQFVNSFTSDLDPKIDSLEINIFEADANTGILSVEAKATFTYLGGNTGEVSSYKTMIVNKTVKED